MARWTTEQYNAVNDAYLRLVTGEQQVSVSFSSEVGQTSMTFQAVNIEKIEALLARMRRDLGLDGTARAVQLTGGR